MKKVLRFLTLAVLLAAPWGGYFNQVQAQQSLPYIEGFETMSSADDLTAAGWIMYKSSSGSFLAIETTASNVHSGSKALDIDSWDASSSSDYVIVGLPVVNEPINGLQITFSYKVSTGTVYVGYLTDANDASSFVSLQSFNSSSSYSTNTVDLSAAPNTAARIAIKYLNWYRCYIDDIDVRALPTCFPPTSLAASNTTAAGATLNWTAGGTETDWVVEYSTASDFTGAASVNVSDTPTANLTGLNPATTYYVRVKADCGGGDESTWTTANFTTSCVAITAAGYTENFDALTAGDNVLPLCWSYINTTTYSYYQGYPKAYADGYSTYSQSAPNCLYLYSYAYYYSGSTSYDPQPQYAILPEMTGLSGKQVTLWAKGYNASSTFKIGTMSNPADASTFTPITEQALTTSYQEFEYLVPSTTDAYLAIMIDAASSSRNTNGVYIDDISIAEPPSCLKPTDVTCSATTTTTATLAWTETGTATAWQICLDGDEANPIVAATNPFTLTGLTSATTYTVKVRANCGANGYSDWSSSTVNVTTKCEAVTAFPWTENFDALTVENSIPTCWNNDDGTTTTESYKWCYNTSTSGNGATSGTGHSGNCVRFDSYYNSSNLTNFLKTIPLSLPASPVMQLSFWYKNPAGGDFSVYISTDGGATYTTSLATGLTGASSWTRIDPILLDAYAGQDVVIVFKGTSNCGYSDAYIYLDDVTVEEAPACLPVSALSVTATTTTTATLAWTETGTATAWQICLDGDEANPIDAATNPFTLTGLTSSTTYTVKVRANCGANGYSDWSSSTVNVTTKCEALTSLPWSENFESYASGNFTPNCWVNEHISGDGTQIFKVYTSTNGSNSTHQLQLPDMSNGTQTRLVLPGMTLPSSNYKFSIDVYRNATGSSYTSEGVRVYASADGEIAGATELGFLYRNYTQTDGGVVTAETASGWYTYVFPIPFSGSCYIILRGESQYGSATYMDNFLVTACTAPTDLTYSELKSDRVDLTWTSDADHWDISTGDDDHPIELADGDDGVSVDGTTVTYRLGGLDPEHAYTVKVRNNCGSDGVSLWSSPVAFTTLAACATPTDVAISNIGAHVADVAWTGDGDEFTVWYRTAMYTDALLKEDFESDASFANWTFISKNTENGIDGTGYNPAGRMDGAAQNGSYGFRFSSYSEADNDDYNQYLISPRFNLAAASNLEFYYKKSNSSTEKFKVGYSTTTNNVEDGVSFTWSAEVNPTTSWQKYELALPADAKYIAIHYYSNYQYYMYIDDIAIGVYDVPAGEWERKDIDAAPAQTTLEGLEAGMKYEVKVTPGCDEDNASAIVNFTTVALPTLSVTAGNWYGIASPMHDDGQTYETVTNVTNLTSGTYDFLRYNEAAHTWESQKSGSGHTGFTYMTPGRGYIYRRSADAVLTFDGEPNRGPFSYTLTLTPAAGNLAGFNLVGNPYTKAVTISSNTSLTGGAVLASGGYTLSTSGTWTAISNYASIAAGQAFLVEATTAGTLNFSAPAGAKGATAGEADADAHILFTVSNDRYTDVAYAMFADGIGLPKIAHLAADAPILSIATVEGDYAIAMMEESVERFPLAFSGNGQYTLRVENNANLGYLHLIDRATGRDIDLLSEPSYTFYATGAADRFTVKLTPSTDEESDTRFVWQEGDRLVITGDGELQVFDVMGRQLATTHVEGTTTYDRHELGLGHSGVYVLRLDGNSQKIVVK